MSKNLNNTMQEENVMFSSPKIDKNKSGELTGYATIDRPWLKYYSDDVINSELPCMTMFDYIYKGGQGDLSKTALNYFDRKISYREMFDNIFKCAKAFSACGVKKGDIVSVIMPTTPESIYILYALNMLGAVSNMIDPRTSTEGIQHYINESNSEFLFVVDQASPKVKDIKKSTGVKHIINVSPTESMTPVAKLKEVKEMFLKEKSEEHKSSLDAAKTVVTNLKLQKLVYGYSDECIQWSDFINMGNGCDVVPVKYEKNMPAVIVHTGGTTGMPKGVVLTNDNLNSASFQCETAGYDFKSEHSWLNIMPLFIAYGCGNGLHLPLACRMETIIIPAFDPEKFDDLLLKYRPNHMVGVPEHYGHIITSKKLKDVDLSFIKAPTVGGDSMVKKLEEATNEFLASHNCSDKIVKGYGMTEVSAAVAACINNEVNALGSVGIPFPKTVISIFNSETGEEIPYINAGDEVTEEYIGDICISGPNTMAGYYNNEEENEKVLICHNDGTLWVHSGDIGYMNSNGELFVIGRKKDLVVRPDGFKNHPEFIEAVILQDDAVESCKVVGRASKDHFQGEFPVAFVVLKDEEALAELIRQNPGINIEDYIDLENIRKRLSDRCMIGLQEYSQPQEIFFIESLPYTLIGKVDVKKLKDMANNMQTNEREYVKK